ncbi:glucose-6-phosphate dehydrogenase [Actinoplanes sp. DH11]|uniref:glucose-6-phosphate dehydrogenase n=1 Tax=Actinoplanes sp. DH11 TaxID=2857011 RepID=UPI001E53BA6D|nr:glucose-6-phosphate dehydrogenase [Actinoplanes sp. DH11]
MTDQTLIILGATGDLTARLLLPGLGALLAAGHVPGLTLIGAATEDWDDSRWQQRVRESSGGSPATRYVRADVTRAADLRTVLAAADGPPAIFFALPPAVTARACEALLEVDLPEGTRLVLEKPFGVSAETAAALNSLLTRLVPEERIHRVDHFLGKATVLNILGLRFANRIFEPLLNNTHVASVEIVFDESLALENRAGYYDNAGALADMIQSHLLQILGLLAMEAPISLAAAEFRDRKADVLRATRLWDDDPAACSRRARYTAGSLSRLAYADEPGVDPHKQTETLAEVVLAVDTWRWSGVPFRLRSGKALGDTRKEAVITFKKPPRVPDGLHGCDQPDRLRIGFGPDRISLDFNINGPGDPFELDPVSLGAEFGPGDLPPYGEVLRGVFDNDPTLSIRADVAEQCWRIVEPVTAAWRAGKVPLQEYPAGSRGPADSLLDG